MAHFAKLNSEGVVEEVITMDNSIVIDENGAEQESLGIQHIHNTIPGSENYTWKQCSRSGSFRKVYPSPGYLYFDHLDVFLPPKPKGYDSWSLNDEIADWQSPVGPKPELTQEQYESDYFYDWDELNQEWFLVEPKPELTAFEKFQGKFYEYDYENRVWVLIEPTIVDRSAQIN